MRHRLSRYTTVAATLTVATTLVATPAVASWQVSTVAGAPTRGHTAASAVPAGSAPAATVTGSSVALSWTAKNIVPGVPVAGYRIRKYNGAGVEQAIGGTCTGIRTTTSCTESVPNGTWSWTVTPVHQSWTGAQSPATQRTVNATTPVVTLGGLPGNPTNVRTASFTFSAPGAASFQCALDSPTFTTCTSPRALSGLTDGQHTFSVRAVDAVGNVGAPASYTWTIDGTAPAPTVVDTASDADGRMENGEQILLTFSEAIAPTSVLAGWSGSSVNIYVVVNNNAGANGNDLLEFYRGTSPFPALPLGTVNLGRNDYTSGDITFEATMALVGNQIRVTLGDDSGSSPRRVTSGGTMTWTTGTGIRDLAGNQITTPQTVSQTVSNELDF